jgi:hypothetical protein
MGSIKLRMPHACASEQPSKVSSQMNLFDVDQPPKQAIPAHNPKNPNELLNEVA